MSTVAILGAGELGGATAHALAAAGCVSRVLLIDTHGQVAAGKALDIQQAGAISAFPTSSRAPPTSTRVAGCSVCVVADRAGPPRPNGGARMGSKLSRALRRMPARLRWCSPAPSRTRCCVRWPTEAGVDRRRLIGSAPEALAASVRAMVAMEAGCSVTEVNLTVLGCAPRGIVVPWVEASVAGYALEKVLTQAQLARVEARLARLWPPGPYTLGRPPPAWWTRSRGRLDGPVASRPCWTANSAPGVRPAPFRRIWARSASNVPRFPP